MADNLDVTAGSGKTVGADEISSVLYQRVKLIYGGDGVNSGDVSTTNPLPVIVSNGTLTVNTVSSVGITGSVSAVSLVAANFLATVNTISTVGINNTVGVVSLTPANFNVVVSNGTLTVNTISTVGINNTVGVVSLIPANFGVVVSSGNITVNTCSTVSVTNTVGVVSLTAANFNVVVSNGTLTVNTVSTVGITGAVTVTTISTVSVTNTVTTIGLLRTTRFQGTLTHSDCTTAITVINGASTNSNLHITSYLISALVAGTYWLEDGAATKLTPAHYFAANGGASFTSVNGTPISTTITATTIKLKSSVAGSVGCLVLGYSA